MIHRHGTCAAMLTLALTACFSSGHHGSVDRDPTTREPRIRSLSDVYDSVYLPVDRTTAPPGGYGLYSVLLTRTFNANTTRILSELFATTGHAGNAAIDPENLNLITIPVKNTDEADSALASARMETDAAAAALMQKQYDFDLAARLMSSVCRPARGKAAMEVCGYTAPDGPLLVTSRRALGGSIPADEKLLIVNLSNTPPGAIPEVLAAYRQQILRKDFADRYELDSWRLQALNHVLEAAKLLPRIKKAYAGLMAP